MDKEKFYKAMVKRFGCVPVLTDYSSSAKNDISLNEALNLIPDDDIRKIPEGSVVLTEEEFNEFRQTIITQSQEYTKRCNEMNDKIINARKEAVKEVLEKINEKLCTFKLENKSQEYSDGYVDAIAEVCSILDETAKEFGVKP